MFYRGQWGTICHHSWSINDATVACRQLGYAYAVRALRGWQVPSGSGPIWLSNVGCTGNEQNLTSCSHSGWGNHNSYCNHTDDAGVECSFGKFFCVVICSVTCSITINIDAHGTHFFQYITTSKYLRSHFLCWIGKFYM